MHQFLVKTPSASSKAKTRSHLAVNITANDRTRKYLPGTFQVEDGMLFCSSCNMVIDHVRKFVADKHLEALKTVLNHKTGVIKMYSQVTLN